MSTRLAAPLEGHALEARARERQAAAEAPLDVAVIIPCYNEEIAIRDVVNGFRQHLPSARIYVYDNNSRDNTAAVAESAGAVVRTERRQGKGNVVRRMFADVDADVYVMVDGDGTYDAASAPRLVEHLVAHDLDMVNGARQEQGHGAYRPMHRLGNRMLTGIVRWFFGTDFLDMLSGYRVFSRRFVKSFPAVSPGFEIETELTIHALQLRLPTDELPTPYGARPAGSVSKLSSFRDGYRIIRMIARLIREEKPLTFFFTGGALGLALAAFLMTPIVFDFFLTGLVPRMPTFVAAMTLVMGSMFSFACGMILDTVAKARREARRLAYLQLQGVAERAGTRLRTERAQHEA